MRDADLQLAGQLVVLKPLIQQRVHQVPPVEQAR
jgi:hypothetical protein